jgi:hypothetical protein
LRERPNVRLPTSNFQQEDDDGRTDAKMSGGTSSFGTGELGIGN